ncbi:MAG: dipeptidase [Bacteroidota bacterium]
MKKFLNIFGLTLSALLFAGVQQVESCTNYLVTRGASSNGSTMITYAADAHVIYGELYFWPAADHKPGSMLDVYEWDTDKFLGQIEQVPHTYQVVGNMNEHQLAIGETTYGGRSELRDTTGIIDYGSLIYISLQRSKTAREAIKTISELTAKYGYYSSGESFSIADPNEVWIMELIGKGPGNKGIVWVARMIPDGYVSGHANQARIQTFPLENNKSSISSDNLDEIFNPEITTVYASDVIDLAREYGWFDGKDKDFSFSDVYAPVDFGGARFCDMRVWSFFRKVNDDMDQYTEYVAGHDLENRMPLWIKPNRKLSNLDLMDMMRDHLEGTPFDMTKDAGAGPFGLPYRWRPLTWSVEGDDKVYCNERATATQQTGFSFVSESRSWLPDPVGGILWFGVDDAAATVYVPMYCGMTRVPESYAVGNGDLLTYSPTSAFWTFSLVSNFAYLMYNYMMEDVREVQSRLETQFAKEVKAIDKATVELMKTDEEAAIEFITDYSVSAGNQTVKEWKQLGEFLLVKYIDGNIKKETDGVFERNPYGYPASPDQPGYPDSWKQKVIEDTGDKLLLPGKGQ